MSIKRRWVATCDGPECTEVYVLEGDQYDGKQVTGESINDRGWDAAPWRVQTFCPEHLTSDERADGAS